MKPLTTIIILFSVLLSLVSLAITHFATKEQLKDLKAYIEYIEKDTRWLECKIKYLECVDIGISKDECKETKLVCQHKVLESYVHD